MASASEIRISAEDLDEIINALHSYGTDDSILEALRLLRRSIKDNRVSTLTITEDSRRECQCQSKEI
jgi:predicted DNA-binding ArsR family transcriptional regulator